MYYMFVINIYVPQFSDVLFLYLVVVLVLDSLIACAVGKRGEYWRRILSIRCCIP
jgi:hypothetical protein